MILMAYESAWQNEPTTARSWTGFTLSEKFANVDSLLPFAKTEFKGVFVASTIYFHGRNISDNLLVRLGKNQF